MTNLRRTLEAYRTWPIAFILGVGATMLLSGLLSEAVDHSRWARDLLNRTAFRQVTIEQVFATPTSLSVEGTFIKVRCLRKGLQAYTVADDGTSAAAEFAALDPRGTPRNRPPMRQPQHFGPWIITATRPNPERAVLFVTHTCPEGEQTNEFFDIPWRTVP